MAALDIGQAKVDSPHQLRIGEKGAPLTSLSYASRNLCRCVDIMLGVSPFDLPEALRDTIHRRSPCVRTTHRSAAKLRRLRQIRTLHLFVRRRAHRGAI